MEKLCNLRSIVSGFRAMDVNEPIVSEECWSMYSPNAPVLCEEYVNPQSACSVQSLGSEINGPIRPSSAYTAPIQEQTSSVPCFKRLLDDGKDEPVDTTYTDISTGTPLRYAGVINSRESYPPTTVPALSCSTDDQIPIPDFDNKEFKPCSNFDDLDLVVQVFKENTACEVEGMIKEEPSIADPVPLGSPYCQASTTVSRPKRKLEANRITPYEMKPSGDSKGSMISDPDAVRKERRKASNRKAAKKCREKKIKEQNAVIQAKEECMAEMARLRAENQFLRQQMAQCQNCSHLVSPPCAYTPPLVHEPS